MWHDHAVWWCVGVAHVISTPRLETSRSSTLITAWPVATVATFRQPPLLHLWRKKHISSRSSHIIPFHLSSSMIHHLTIITLSSLSSDQVFILLLIICFHYLFSISLLKSLLKSFLSFHFHSSIAFHLINFFLLIFNPIIWLPFLSHYHSVKVSHQLFFNLPLTFCYHNYDSCSSQCRAAVID